MRWFLVVITPILLPNVKHATVTIIFPSISHTDSWTQGFITNLDIWFIFRNLGSQLSSTDTLSKTITVQATLTPLQSPANYSRRPYDARRCRGLRMADTPGNIVQAQPAVLSDDGSGTSRRSSSQASRTSTESSKNGIIRKPRRQTSKPTISRTHTRDPSLTSFPSFSQGPEDQNAPASEPQGPLRTTSQRVRDRKVTLAGLTGPPSVPGPKQNALFDDSPRSSMDIPGSLHLATDSHIERLIARTGGVKLVRQYASDLAQRDSEISTLRARADLRERELKKMLREADVPTSEVEKRLLRIERPELSTLREVDNESGLKRKSATSLDDMMSEAMSEEMSLGFSDGVQSISAIAEPLEGRKQSLAQTTLRRINSTSLEGSRESAVSSRTASRANSVASTHGQDADATLRPRNPSSNSRLPGFQSIFQPPTNNTSYFIGGNAKTVKKPKAVDELSVRSNQSGRSTSSWMRIFGSGPQTTRSRASSLDQNKKPTPGHVDAAASLSKVRTVSAAQPQKSATATGQAKSRPIPGRALTGGRLSTSPNHIRKDSNASNMPPTVELDSMIESSQLPPTMTDHNPEGLLTDRFGFIYDRKRKRNHLQAQKQPKSKTDLPPTVDLTKTGNRSIESGGVNRPSTPASIDEDTPKKAWQDYLTPSSNTGKGRPRELLSHTPSAGAVVTVSSADTTGTLTPPRVLDNSISVSSQKAPPSVSPITRTESSAVAISVGTTQENDTEASELVATKMLLDQLTEVHDALQAERTVKWNDFLRRVRAERAVTTDRAANNAPEADLVDGELVGIATLGRSNKTKSKFMHFKSLVLAGIPVSLRPKVWAECSGATQMRTPGYYEDLVARSEEGSDIDMEIAHQITADVKRTLRDNIFFRDPMGPGAQRLEELLRAYSLHNPKIGYCQGMNLITASLLLICASPEDCFWLLVAIIDHILPSGYFDYSLLTARADQIVLRQYVTEVLPKLDAKLQDLGVELEACTFHWFLSLYSGVLTGGEALYRIWDVVLCLNSSDAMPNHQASNSQSRITSADLTLQASKAPMSPTVHKSSDSTPSPSSSIRNKDSHDGTSSPFLFQLSLALLKLNEPAILALDSPATVYTYLNHNMTAHNITIDALVAASEGLRGNVVRKDVLERRRAAVKSLS